MINWKEGTPTACIKRAIVIYDGDYEFARWDGKRWMIWIYPDPNSQFWVAASKPIDYYEILNMPNQFDLV